MSSEKLKLSKKEFEDLNAENNFTPSQWSSPLHLVDKRKQEWRPTGDYPRLSLMASSSPIPHIQDCNHSLQGKK